MTTCLNVRSELPARIANETFKPTVASHKNGGLPEWVLQFPEFVEESMAKKTKKKNRFSQCPRCREVFERNIEFLRGHFLDCHGRLPTHGEENQFKAYRSAAPPYNEKDFLKPRCEVSGGRFSPK